MIHRYEAVTVAKVIGYIEADSQEEARARVEEGECGEISKIYLQSFSLLDELDPPEGPEEEDEI